MAWDKWSPIEKFFLLKAGSFEECAATIGYAEAKVKEIYQNRLSSYGEFFEIANEGEKLHFRVKKPEFFEDPAVCQIFSEQEVKRMRAESEQRGLIPVKPAPTDSTSPKHRTAAHVHKNPTPPKGVDQVALGLPEATHPDNSAAAPAATTMHLPTKNQPAKTAPANVHRRSGKIVGIDLGTTNSVLAVMEGGGPIVIESLEGSRTLPSVVAFTKGGECLVGEPAKRQATTNPENTISSVNRFMGRRFTETKEENRNLPYKVISGPEGHCRVVARDQEYHPQEIAATILQKLKQAAEQHLGGQVSQAVIAVPAYLDGNQRQAIKDVGKLAELEILRIVSAPTAAALAYWFDKKTDETIAVYDFGGGTFDISILEVGEGVVEVKSTNGDTHLGGDDIDKRVMDWIVSEFQKDQGIDLSKDRMALQRLKEAAEKAKMELSTLLETEINLPFITADASGPKHLTMKLTRACFGQMCEDIFQRSVAPVKQAMKDAGVTPDKINEVVLVGGSIRIPRIQQIVKDLFGGKEPHKGVNPDEVVAVGAAIQAGVLGGEVKDLLLLEVTTLTLGVETIGGVATPLIQRNTTIPTRKTETFSTAADNQTSVEIHVLQGERPLAKDNRTLGKFRLNGIPSAPRGIPQIEVTFDIDANGILNVSAKDLGTGNEQKITLSP